MKQFILEIAVCFCTIALTATMVPYATAAVAHLSHQFSGSRGEKGLGDKECHTHWNSVWDTLTLKTEPQTTACGSVT